MTDVTVALAEIERRLESHFTALSAAKQQVGQPVFALEHCLSPEEVAAMRTLLSASLLRFGMHPQFKHCWIVHAAEHGYTFDGLEYWQSFAELTKNWNYYGDRDTLRAWYTQFAETYQGVRPVGRWGQHYTYIAWPITHALLPSDLQVQLAQTLYNIRYRLDELILLRPESVGRLVAKQADWPTSRFRLFLEQHDLVGRVVRALLEGDPEETVIYRPTLTRITQDLNAKNNARAWLKDAKLHYAKFRAQLAASNPRFQLNPVPQQTEEEKIQSELDAEGVLLRPRLQLRRKSSTEWEAYVLIPPLQQLVNVKPQFREHLAQVRFRIPAHGPSMYLGLSLLSGRPVPRRLVQWPPERRPLLDFTAPNKFFDAIVQVECQLPPANLWVFVCAEDGGAAHVLGQHVRPGKSYVVVARDPQKLAGLGERVSLQCEGVTAIRLELPGVVDPALAKKLQHAGIALISKLRIEPVGLRPRQWSDDGVGEWLSTETPLLALSCDHAFDGFQVDSIGGNSQHLPRNSQEAATLVALPDLPVGRHEVTISALVVNDGPLGVHRKAVARADLVVYVRHPTTWSPRTGLPSAMVVDTNPPVPSIDDLLEQRLELQAEGDESRNAVCSVVLTDPVTGNETAAEILRHRLPLTKSLWADALAHFIQRNDELQFLAASGAYISVQAEDLGECRIPLQYEPDPVRWAMRRCKPSPALFLINEGASDPLSVAWYPFDHPLQPQAIEEEAATKGVKIAGKGGLYLASYGRTQTAIVAAAPVAAHGFASLGAQVNKMELESYGVFDGLIEHLALWQSARACNYLAKIKQRSVCDSIRRQMYSRICGNHWTRLEESLKLRPHDQRCWEELENAVLQIPSFAISLSKAWGENGGREDFDIAQCFFELARKFQVSFREDQWQLAWMLASDPASLHGQHPAPAPNHQQLPTLVRGARLLWLSKKLGRGSV
jgi:hypothetical protein